MTMTSLLLKIDFNATPVTGTLEDDHGRRHDFTGWLGLSDALRRIGTDETARPAVGVLDPPAAVTYGPQLQSQGDRPRRRD